MNVRLHRYSEQWRVVWEATVLESINGTFLHSRRYLDYHGPRFDDASFLVELKGSIVGVIPLNVDAKSGVATSHAGLSYGGVVHSGTLTGNKMMSTLEQLFRELGKLGVVTLLYRSIPLHLQKTPAQDDEWCLLSAGARILRTDINSVMQLPREIPVASRKSRNLRRGKGLEVREMESTKDLTAFYGILATNLWTRHKVDPVHSCDELRHLVGTFADEMRLYVACDSTEVVSGVLIYRTATAWHSQYIASSHESNRSNGTDVVLERCIGDAEKDGARVFSLGVSNVGGDLNTGLYTFKSEFGAAGILHRTYELAL